MAASLVCIIFTVADYVAKSFADFQRVLWRVPYPIYACNSACLLRVTRREEAKLCVNWLANTT